MGEKENLDCFHICKKSAKGANRPLKKPIHLQLTLRLEAGVFSAVAFDKDMNDFFNADEINNEELIARRKKDLGIGVGEEEEHELSENDLPDMYRYVFLKDQYSGGNAIAVRVYDEEARWKFVFANKYEIVNIPMNWQYVDSDLAEILNRPGEEFCIEKIKAKYPPKS